MKEKRYLLKITLSKIEPEIWRRFVVPADITLDRLHDVIQIVMGWGDSHLHQFMIGKNRYTESPECEEDGLESGKFRLGDLVKQKGRSFSYLYDFGDNWIHEIALEESRYASPEVQLEVECLDGARACPIEDIGGVPGYHEFCEAMKDPSHEEHESVSEWYGEPFDGEEFIVDDVNEELMIYLRWSRDRFLPWRETPAAQV